jgi:hypothetical protein
MTNAEVMTKVEFRSSGEREDIRASSFGFCSCFIIQIPSFR